MKSLRRLAVCAAITCALLTFANSRACAFQQSSDFYQTAHEHRSSDHLYDSNSHPLTPRQENGIQDEQESDGAIQDIGNNENDSLESIDDWFSGLKVGYDGGFVIANQSAVDLEAGSYPYRLRINGWGQLRHTILESENAIADQNLFQLKRARIIFSGSAFTRDFSYFVQLDGRSSSGDNVRLLDYFLTYDVGSHRFGLERGKIGFKTGRYKIPFTMARYLSGREFEFADRSVASTFFDVNRSLAWGLFGQTEGIYTPVQWETAIFNGLVTGGAETGSSGTLDDNFAYSFRLMCYPIGEWGKGELADFDYHCRPAVRAGFAFANSTIDALGETEFNRVRVVDSGQRLSDLLLLDPGTAGASEYTVNLYSADYSMKYCGWSFSFEYYLRSITQFRGASVPNLFDYGHWLQIGKFIVPAKTQLIARWSRVDGNSGTLGQFDQSSDERAFGLVQYFRDQHAKLTIDATYLDGAPINSPALDVRPGDAGWLFRTQIQFSF